jgi:RNase H-fold protein (predicted Holliday junction resolvase)
MNIHNNIISGNQENNVLSVKAVFYPEKITALLHLEGQKINTDTKKEIAKTLNLIKKEEFHLTVIGTDTGKKIQKALEDLEETDKNKIIDHIQQLHETFNWTVRLQDEFYCIEKTYKSSHNDDNDPQQAETRKSIIQMAEIEEINLFYQQLNDVMKTDFHIPLPHITLYTTSTSEDKISRGIGIYSKEQFENLNPQKI